LFREAALVASPATMQIGSKKVVSLEYTLKNDKGDVLDSSEGREPLAYLHGAGNIIPGLEKALEGKGAGDELEVAVTPENGYGQRDEKLVRNMPVRKIMEKNLQVGGRYPAQTDQGPRLVQVLALRGDYAHVDQNHPLAGQNLNFKVKVVAVRDATEEEVQHGHVHGPEGHAHG
jgi:FKBP-type peptidyl-prolyl cis-trans isomerase SlyD